MWISTNKSFLSVVKPAKADPKAAGGDKLLVRARVKGHIENVFPGAEVITIPGRDYLYRAYIDRATVAQVMMDQIQGIEYGNFKDSVKNHALHDAYARVWHVMGRLQPGGPYGGGI